jgi:hypothetical protein
MCWILEWTRQNQFLKQNSLDKSQSVIFPRKGLHPLAWALNLPCKLSHWRSVQKPGELNLTTLLQRHFWGYDSVPRATILHSLLTSQILKAPRLSDYTPHASCRRAACWSITQSSLLVDVRLQGITAQSGHHGCRGSCSGWVKNGGGGMEEKRGRRLLFILHVSFSGSHKFLCPVYFTQLSKWGLLI